MSYINTNWVVDEVANDVIALDDVTSYSDSVDRDIEILAGVNKLRVDEIPVDGSGYVSSRMLQKYGVLLYKRYLFLGYWGSSRGEEEDIYKEKFEVVDGELVKLENSITRESILGIFTEEGEPKGKVAVIKSIPIGGRG
jgi:hypothetical protein